MPGISINLVPVASLALTYIAEAGRGQSTQGEDYWLLGRHNKPGDFAPEVRPQLPICPHSNYWTSRLLPQVLDAFPDVPWLATVQP
jgi:hypothetical protein